MYIQNTRVLTTFFFLVVSSFKIIFLIGSIMICSRWIVRINDRRTWCLFIFNTPVLLLLLLLLRNVGWACRNPSTRKGRCVDARQKGIRSVQTEVYRCSFWPRVIKIHIGDSNHIMLNVCVQIV